MALYPSLKAPQPTTVFSLNSATVTAQKAYDHPYAFSIFGKHCQLSLSGTSSEEVAAWVKVLEKHAHLCVERKLADGEVTQIYLTPSAKENFIARLSMLFERKAPISPEEFWNAHFPKVDKIPWRVFCESFEKFFHQKVLTGEYSASFFCLANIASQGKISTNNVITKADFRLFISLFGPLESCVLHCYEIIKEGYFFGELSAEESEVMLGRKRIPGTFLFHLLHGQRFQMAIAVVDENNKPVHSLIDIDSDNQYSIRNTNKSFSSLPNLVLGYPKKLLIPKKSFIMDMFGPASLEDQTLAREGMNSAATIELSKVVFNLRRELQGKRQRDLVNMTLRNSQGGANSTPEVPVPLSQLLVEECKKCKEKIKIHIRIPVAKIEKDMVVDSSSSGRDVLQRAVLGSTVENAEFLGIYLPLSGVWGDMDHSLSSMLLSDDCGVDFLFQPSQRLNTVTVRNYVVDVTEEILVDNTTTVFGLIQAVSKGSEQLTPRTGIRLSVTKKNDETNSFFCDITRLCYDYEIGTKYFTVDYMVTNSVDVFMPPTIASLEDKPEEMSTEEIVAKLQEIEVTLEQEKLKGIKKVQTETMRRRENAKKQKSKAELMQGLLNESAKLHEDLTIIDKEAVEDAHWLCDVAELLSILAASRTGSNFYNESLPSICKKLKELFSGPEEVIKRRSKLLNSGMLDKEAVADLIEVLLSIGCTLRL